MSFTPMIDTSTVAIVRMAYRFIHGGSMRLTHCGKMIIHIVWRRVNASEAADSHCGVGIDCTAPRRISDTFAITGSDKPKGALIQSGNGIVMPKTVTWKGSRNMQ